MLHDLISTHRGTEKVIMTDQLPKVNDRLKDLRASQRHVKGNKVVFSVRPTEKTDKYKKPPRKSW